MLGFTTDEWLSAPDFWLQRVHPEDHDAALAQSESMLASGSGISEFRWITKHGHVIWVRVIATAIRDEAGKAVGLRGITLDISAQRRAQLSVELIAHTGEILNESLDYEATLQALTQIIVPAMADWCSVHVVENGEVHQVALHHRDPEKVRWAFELQEKFPPDPGRAARSARSHPNGQI